MMDHEPTATAVAKFHQTSLAVWDVPTPIEEGAGVHVKVGVKCKEDCNLAGALIEVLDSDGRQVSSGVVGEIPAEGTKALYWAQLELRILESLGYHEWTAHFPELAGQHAHLEARYKFGTQVIIKTSCRFSVAVAEGATKALLPNAYVRIGGKTQFTDGSGRSVVSVPKGSQELVVWKRDHKMFRTTVNVDNDVEQSVELVPSPCKYCPDST